jgi:hypothetical protein
MALVSRVTIRGDRDPDRQGTYTYVGIGTDWVAVGQPKDILWAEVLMLPDFTESKCTSQ